ncbi:hypothetical protein [Kitasatospora phosalacinea]|uniref:Uncharacterized protein n=1 Tax=Kitasatospora phosalacinea TaxID=2065 RepID=A0ABW6GRJ8_9ACTN
MTDIVFNVAKGRVGALALLPAASDALIAIPYASSGFPSDATLRDCTTVAAIATAGATEQTTMGRKTLTNVTSTVDQTNDRWAADCDDITWTAPSGAAIGCIVIAYDPDTTTGTDTDLIPLVKLGATLTPDGVNDYKLTINDFYWAQ